MGRLRRLSPLLVLVAVLTALVVSGSASATTTLTFQNNTYPFQDDFRGANAVHMGFNGMPEATGMTPALRTLENDRVQDSGVKVVRTWYGEDWALPNFPSTTGGYQWTSSRMNAFYDWLQAMKDRNVTVALTTGWTFPGDICSTDNSNCTPTPSDLTTYAHWVSDSLNQLINVKGFTNIRYALLFTEANGTYTGLIPSGYDRFSYYRHVADAVQAQIVSDDASRTPVRSRIQIVGPEESSQIGTLNNDMTKYMKANAAGDFDIYSTHRYCQRPAWSGPSPMSLYDCPEFGDWKSYFDTYVSDVAPSPLWADELGTLADTDQPAPYRDSADYGTYLDTALAAQMNAGVQSSFVWMLQDQRFVAPNATLFQHYGLAKWLPDSSDVRPSWYAYALAANLLGGGGTPTSGRSTYVFHTTGGTADVNGAAVNVPQGVGGCTVSVGCGAFMVVNRSGSPQQVAWGFSLAQPSPGITMYRYLYNGGNPPRPSSDKPASVPSWDARYDNVTTGVPANTIPADSVAIYSMVNRGTPPTNLAPAATASASSTAAGSSAALVNDRDANELSGAGEGWLPNASASGAQSVELQWPSATAIDRLELDFPASAPPTDYTIQYWNGSAWADVSSPINVHGSEQAHRTHTFTSVSTTRIRLTVPSSASPGVNEIQAFHAASARDTALGFAATTDNAAPSNNKYDYERISNASYTFQAGDRIEYDVRLLDNVANIGGIDADVPGACGEALRNAPSGWVDQNGLGGHPGTDLSSRAYPGWYHRVLAVPACAVGHAASDWMVASEQDGQVCVKYSGATCTDQAGRKATAFYDDLVVKHANGTVGLSVYTGGAPQTIESELRSRTPGHDVFVTAKSPE